MELHLPFTLANFSLLLLFVFPLVLLIFRRSRNRKTTANLPPGPWKLPIIGSIHHLAGSGLPHHALRGLSRRYGPLMHMQLGEISAIVVSSPGMAKQVMKTHDLAFANRPELLASKITLYDSQDIVFSPHGPYWRQMRKICILELLSAKNVRSFCSIRNDEVGKLIEFVKSSKGLPINMTEKIYSLTSTITARAAFGKQCKDQDVVIQIIKEGDSLAGGFDVSDLFPSLTLLHVLSGARHKLTSLHLRMDKILQRILDEHEENVASTRRGNGESGEEDLVDALLRHQKSDDLECPITTNNIKAVIMDVIAAGTDTSSSTVVWAMSEMMRNPKVMEKAQNEVRKVLKGKKTIHEADMQGLDYMKLVIKETLRLHPPLALLAPRESREQCEIEGYKIPTKTKVIVNARAIGRDPEYWHDAESFVPERFDETSVDFTGTDFKYIPFGAGRRICPGISFGLANVEAPLAQLLYHFDWKLPNGVKPEDLDMTENFGATVGRKKALYLIATPYDSFLNE